MTYIHKLLALTLALLTPPSLGCGPDDLPDETEATPDPPAPDPAPTKISERVFAPFEAWARPIEDYLAVGTQTQTGAFDTRINDLAPQGASMFIGYGDGNVNLGEHIPIEFRYFLRPDEPTTQPAPIEATGQGATQQSPYQSGEEQIDRYRMLDGELWQAGVDSIDADELHTQATTNPKAIAGNVYRFDGVTWRKYRSIMGGEHVHDVASFQGAVYAVGSGADTRLEFEAGQIFRYLWRTSDLGQSFETVQRVQHPSPGQGDIRWVTMLPTPGALYLFGYVSSFSMNSATVSNSVFDGAEVSDLPEGHALSRVYPQNVLPLPDGGALLFGVDLAAEPVHNTALLVAADGSVSPLTSLAGQTVLDAMFAEESGEIVYLTMAGDTYGATPASYDLRVLVADAETPDATHELQQLSTAVSPASVAYWQNALFLGTGDGAVLRAPAP